MSHVYSLLVLIISFTTQASASAIIPPPGGQYGVGLTTIKLTDRTRTDVYAPDHGHRNVMVSAFYPAASAEKCNTVLVDYMPPATAAIEDQYY